MSQTKATAIADFLLRLYSSAREQNVVAFPEFAIHELKRFVDFDMALFGLIRPDRTAAFGLVCSWAHIHREPTNMVEEWMSLCADDLVLQTMVSNVGQVRSYHVPSVFTKHEDAKILDFALRTRHINLAAVSNNYAPCGVLGAFSVRRADTAWKFSLKENNLIQTLSPHIWEAIRINRTIMSGNLQALSSEPFRGLCITDDQGLIIFQDVAFERLQLMVFRDHNAYRLPNELRLSLIVGEEESYQNGRLLFTCKKVVNLRLLTVTLSSGLSGLTSRETEIARFYGTGLTYTEISDELKISSATVRRHIESVYRKLQIKTKADLALILLTDKDRGVEQTLSALQAALEQNH